MNYDRTQAIKGQKNKTLKKIMSTKKDPTLAAIFSFLCTGLGHVYIGKVWRGIIFFFLTIIGYCFWIVPGIILHIICIWDAYDQTKKLNETKEK